MFVNLLYYTMVLPKLSKLNEQDNLAAVVIAINIIKGAFCAQPFVSNNPSIC